MLQPLSHLPAFSLVEPLLQAIVNQNMIIGAPPGAGKSTVLPLSLLNTHIKGKILLMQPRRVVVRNLAQYMAGVLGEQVGDTVGYRIRGENKVSASTRLEIITEGILSRMIQSDPELDGVAVIIFDEFHERSIHSDFGLALALEVQAGLRDDLRLMIMSATLDTAPIASLLAQHSPVPTAQLASEGRSFPVTVNYTKDVLAHEVIPHCVEVIMNAVTNHQGDILVFLAGAGAIHAVASRLSAHQQQNDYIIHTLYGAMGKQAQQAAIAPDPEGQRKVILATNIAETSLTIEGVKVVIDSLWENSAEFHPSSGLTQLTQTRISKASAIQRTGRAGRVSEGVCYRLSAKESFERFAEHSAPQILREDVAPLLLETLNWGTHFSNLAMLTQPSKAQSAIAIKALEEIGAVNEKGDLTAYGRVLAQIPCHPQLAHLLLFTKQNISAVAQFSDAQKRAIKTAAPFIVALAQAQLQSEHVLISDALLHLTPAQRNDITKQAKRYAQSVGLSEQALDLSALDDEALGLCIAIAFPRQVAFKTSASYKLARGKGADISLVNPPQWIAVLQGQHIGNSVKIRLAQPIAEAHLKALYPNQFTSSPKVQFNKESQVMEARKETSFYAIELASSPLSKSERADDPQFYLQETASAWLRYLDALPLKQWPLSQANWRWWYRVKLAAQLNLPQPQAYDTPDPWPTSLSELLTQAREQLAQSLGTCKNLQSLHGLGWSKILTSALSWPQQDALSQSLPDSVVIPTGRKANLDYRENGDVVLSVKMQELYGLSSPYVVADGKVKITYELLSPAGRPLQTTKDIVGFWQGSYKEVQKEMKGRYPKHFWPDDPANAIPTTKTKKAMDRQAAK